MAKVCTWIPLTEYQAIIEAKGDISSSLFIRRAIKKALLEGNGLPASDPNQTAVVPNAATSTPTPQANKQEVEVVS